jgi:hypothetical protein
MKQNFLKFAYTIHGRLFCDLTNDFLAQPVEQLTLNQWVRGSIPRGVTDNALSRLLRAFLINSCEVSVSNTIF